MKVEYELLSRDQVTDQVRQVFADALKSQGKVRGPLLEKAGRCKHLCIARVDGKVVGIGAIKVKTESDFSATKANLSDVGPAFSWELGYLFTEPAYKGQGIAKYICRLLMDAYGNENLMASTELGANPAMVHILEGLGFKHYGTPWKSDIHGNFLGLFLKFRS